MPANQPIKSGIEAQTQSQIDEQKAAALAHAQQVEAEAIAARAGEGEGAVSQSTHPSVTVSTTSPIVAPASTTTPSPQPQRETQYDSPEQKAEAEHATEVAADIALRDARAAEARGQEQSVIEAQAAADEGRATPEQKTILMQMGDTAYGTTVKDASGKTITLTPVQVKEITTSAGDEKFNAMVRYGLIPQGSIYVDENSYLTPDRVREIQDNNPELGKILTTQGYADYKLAASKLIEATAMANEQALKDFEQKLKDAPQELQDAYNKTPGTVTDKIAAYNEAVDAYNRVEHPNPFPFGAGVVKLSDNTYITQDNYNKLSDRYKSILMNFGIDALQEAITADNQRRQSALNALSDYKSTNDKGETTYDISKFVAGHPDLTSVGILNTLNFDPKTITAARTYVDNTDAVVNQLGFDPNKYSFGAMQIQADALGLVTRDRPGVFEVKRNLEIIDPRAFINSLSQEQQKSLIGAMANDPNNKNVFASAVEQYNFRYSKLPLADQIITPFIPNIGMPLVAVQMVSTTAAKVTTGQQITPMELATDTAATALAVLSHVAPVIRGVPEAPVKVLGISGGAIVKSVEVGAIGVFGTNIAVNWKDMSTTDKVVNTLMMTLPAIGLAKDVYKFSIKGAEPAPLEVAKQQAAILDHIIQTNKDFISREVITDPAEAVKAEQSFNTMRSKIEDYATKSLELKQTQKAISDIGLAKSKEELSLLASLRDKVSPLTDAEMRELLGLKANDKTPTVELRKSLGLGDTSTDLSSQVEKARDAAERAYGDYAGILGRNIKVDDPAVLDALKDVSKDAIRNLDSVTTQIVSPRTAVDIAKDVGDISKRIREVEIRSRDREITPAQIDAYGKLIKDLNSEIIQLNKEARFRYLSTGETATVSGNDITSETKSLQQRLIEANAELESFKKSSLDYGIYQKGLLVNEATVRAAERDIFEAIQNVTESSVGRESYVGVLERLNDSLSSLLEFAKGDIKLESKISEVSFDIYKSIRNGDVVALKEGIRLLQIEANNLPTPLQLKAGEEIKQLETFATNILRETLSGKVTPPSEEFKFGGLEGEPRSNLIKQQAERTIERRWEKLFARVPEGMKKQSTEQIKEYLKQIYDKDYFDSAYDGLYKDLDDFLDVGRAEVEIKNGIEKQTTVDKIKQDIEISETEKSLADKFEKTVTDEGLKKMIRERSDTFKRQIEEKKAKLDIAVKEKIVIPLTKIDLERTTESPVKESESLVPSEKSLTQVIKEKQAGEKAEREVARAKEEVAKERASAFPGITPKVTIITRSGRTFQAKPEHIGAMTPQQAQRLYGDQFQITESYVPYRINADGTITRLEPIIRTTTWLSPSDAVQEAQQIHTRQLTEVETGTQINVSPEIQVAPETKTLTDLQTQVVTQPRVETEIKPEVTPELITGVGLVVKEPPPPTEKIKHPLAISEKKQKQQAIVKTPPPGTVVLIQGRPQYKGDTHAPMFKVITPPYKQEDMFTTRQTPVGYRDEGFTGEGMAFKSIQVLGGIPDQPIRDLDLGFVRINIDFPGGKPVISYPHDADSNTGERSQTVGMGKGQIPIEEWDAAKAQGIKYEDFIASYKGGLVNGNVEVASQAEKPVASVAQTEPEVKPADAGLDKKLIYQFGNRKVYSVDGEYIRDVMSEEFPEMQDFTDGGNYKVYNRVIPKDEYWVEEVLKPVDMKATAIHEITEADAMGDNVGKGKAYENAHADVANVIEYHSRYNQALMDEYLQRALRGNWRGLLTEAEKKSHKEPKETGEEMLQPVNRAWYEQPRAKPKPIISTDRYYRGYRILPPDLGGSL